MGPFAFPEEELGFMLTALVSKTRAGTAKLVLKAMFAVQLKRLIQLT